MSKQKSTTKLTAEQLEERFDEGADDILEHFDLTKARRLSRGERAAARKAAAVKLGRRPKPAAEKFVAISFRIHPQTLAWAKAEAKRLGTGYQTVLNDRLLAAAGKKRKTS